MTSRMRTLLKKIKIILAIGGILAFNLLPATGVAFATKSSECATILKNFCPEDGDNGEAIKELLKFVIQIMTAGVVVLGTIGIIICGVMWMTAGSSEEQVRKAKKRLVEIVVGMVLFIMIDVIINLLLPGKVDWR